MAMLPVLLDMVDEIYNSLDDQSKTFPDSIPLLFVPQRTGGGCPEGIKLRRQLRNGARSCARRCPGGVCVKPNTDFQVALDVSSFKPEEITVKVKGQDIIIEGKHEERADEFGFISQQFSRRIVLPEEFDPDTVSTFLNAEGKLQVKATKPLPKPDESSERIIPIQRVPSAAKSETSEQGLEKVEKVAKEAPKEGEQTKE